MGGVLNLQKAHGKDHEDSILARTCHLQLPNDWLREQQDQDVQDYVETGSNNVASLPIDAVAGNPEIPESLKRLTASEVRDEG